MKLYHVCYCVCSVQQILILYIMEVSLGLNLAHAIDIICYISEILAIGSVVIHLNYLLYVYSTLYSVRTEKLGWKDCHMRPYLVHSDHFVHDGSVNIYNTDVQYSVFGACSLCVYVEYDIFSHNFNI